MWELREEGCCGRKKGADASVLAGGGFGDCGEGQVPVPTLCPTGRRAMLLHPGLMLSYSLA